MAERPFEQLKLDFGYQGLGGTFVGGRWLRTTTPRRAGRTTRRPTSSLMLAIPGMEVLIPGHGDEVDRLLRATYANGRPTYLRASVATNTDAFDVAPGRIEVVRRGAGATVLAFGPMLDRVLAASEGLDVTVRTRRVSRRSTTSGLRAIAGAAPRVLVVEPFYEGTSAPVLAETFRGVPAALAFIGVPRAFIHGYGTPADLDADVGLDVPGLKERISSVI